MVGREMKKGLGKVIQGGVVACAALLVLGVFAAPADAGGPRRGLMLMGGLGFSAETDADEVEIEGGATGSVDSDEVEDLLGFVGIYEVNPGVRNVAAGGRVFVGTGTLEDSDDELLAVDGGIWARYYQPVGENLFVWGGGAAGLSFGQRTDDDDSDNQVSGIGYHIVVGGGATFGLSKKLGLVGGLFYEYQGFPSLSGESGGIDVEFKDAEMSFLMLQAGVIFDI